MTTINPITNYKIKTYSDNKTEAKGSKNGKASNKADETAKGDTVSLSGISKDYITAKTSVENAPDVRMEKIEPLKKAIEEGTYKINADKIAEKMLNSILGDMA